MERAAQPPGLAKAPASVVGVFPSSGADEELEAACNTAASSSMYVVSNSLREGAAVSEETRLLKAIHDQIRTTEDAAFIIGWCLAPATAAQLRAVHEALSEFQRATNDKYWQAKLERFGQPHPL